MKEGNLKWLHTVWFQLYEFWKRQNYEDSKKKHQWLPRVEDKQRWISVTERKAMTNLDSMFKSRHYFDNKGLSCQSYGFPSSHGWMGELDHKESSAQKNWCFWTVLLNSESPLDCKEIKPVHPKWNQSWIFIGRTDAEAETPILWPPDAKNWLIWIDPDTGKDWRQEKETTEDEMVGWHHLLNGHEFE